MALGIGIVSVAHGHVRMYGMEIKKRSDARVIALWDADMQRGTDAAQKLETTFEPNLDALLARKDIQAVMIGSETAKHAEHAIAAANAGKDILLQKPMATTLEDCRRIADAVKRNGVRFSLAWQMRCDPQNLWIKEAVSAEKFGKISLVRRRHGLTTQRMGFLVGSWHVDPQMNVGMFFDDAAHPIDWLLWTFGEPESVTAEITTVVNPAIPDDCGVAVFRYADGKLAIVETTFTCAAAEDTIGIYGVNGTILQRYGDAPACNLPAEADRRGLRYRLLDEKGWNWVEPLSPQSHGERISGVTAPALAFLKGERDPIASAEEGIKATQMLLAAYTSAREGRRVKLNFD